MPKINQLKPATSLANTDIMIADTSTGSDTRKIAYSDLRTQVQNESKSVFALKGEIASDDQVADAVGDWLDTHVTPTGSAVAIDDTLKIQGAAADAKAAGEIIVVNGTSGNGTRVNITTTDTDIELAEMSDVTELKNAIGDIVIYSKNLYDPNDPDVLHNKYMNISGVISDYDNRTVTGYMPVIPGKKLVISRVVNGVQEAFTWAALCMFDAGKNVVSGGNYNQSGTTIPSGVAYVRGTMTATYPDVQYELCDDTAFTAYMPYSITLSDDIIISDVDRLEAIASDTTRGRQTATSTDLEPSLTFTNGLMGRDGTVTSSTSYSYSNKIPVKAGDIFNTSGIGWRAVAAFNLTSVVTDAGINGTSAAITSYTVPEGIYYIVITRYNSHINEGINLIVDSVKYENTVKENIEPYLRFSSGYMGQNGVIASSTTLKYSNKIPVLPGDVIETEGIGWRFITAFSGNTTVQASGVQNVAKYVVPDGIDGIVITAYISHTGEGILISTTESNYNKINAKRIAAGYMSEAKSLVSGENITLPQHNVKNGNRYIFNANITTFDTVYFSKGTPRVTVNATTVSVTSDLGNVVTFNHGLTITHDITIDIEEGESLYLSKLRIASAGNVYEAPMSPVVRFNADSGSPSIVSTGSSLTDCRFSWTSRNAEKPIWLFGDSYFSWYPQRWTYYAAQDGNLEGCLLNGFAGQNSASAITSLYNLLSVYRPKTIVWCLGMNDGDTASAVNASWKTNYEKVLAMSKDYGFELVLYTVPTTPTINNNFKNEIIRSSGLRYIEADKAVRIDSSGNWVAGALSDDNVHPTELGAKILYYRILADFPEIMCK